MNYRIKKLSSYRQLSKYKNSPKWYNGINYDSKLEAKVAQELDLRVKAIDDNLISWERQVKIDLSVNGDHICNYYIDFVAEREDGVKEYIEVKGLELPVWKLKWNLFCALYKEQIEKGEIEVMVVKQ
jgi:hypothetical protein